MGYYISDGAAQGPTDQGPTTVAMRRSAQQRHWACWLVLGTSATARPTGGGRQPAAGGTHVKYS